MTREKLFTPEEIAEHLKITKQTVMAHIRSRQIRARKVGRFWRVSESDLQVYLDAYVNQPGKIGRLMWDIPPEEVTPPLPSAIEEVDCPKALAQARGALTKFICFLCPVDVPIAPPTKDNLQTFPLADINAVLRHEGFALHADDHHRTFTLRRRTRDVAATRAPEGGPP